MEESQRQNLVMAFNNVMRTSSLVGVIDLQRAGMAFSTLLDSCPPDEPLPLGPLYDFLLEQKAPELGAREVLVFLKSRESRFGVTMQLPPALQNLSDEEQQKLVAAFTNRGTTSGTYAKPPEPPPGRATAPPDPKKPKPGMPLQNKLIVVLVLGAVALIINIIFGVATADPPHKVLTLSDPAGLPCKEALGGKGVASCKVPLAFFKDNPESVINARLAVTKSATMAQGFTKLYVFSIEDNKMRLAR